MVDRSEAMIKSPLPLSSLLEEYIGCHDSSLDLNCNVIKDAAQAEATIPVVDICTSSDDDSGLELGFPKEVANSSLSPSPYHVEPTVSEPCDRLQSTDLNVESHSPNASFMLDNPLPSISELSSLGVKNVLASYLDYKPIETSTISKNVCEMLSTSHESYLEIDLDKSEQIEIEKLQEMEQCLDAEENSLSSLDSGNVPSPATEALLLHESEQLKLSVTEMNHLESSSSKLGHLKSNSTEFDHLESSTIEFNHVKSSTTKFDYLKSGSPESDHFKSGSPESDHFKSGSPESDHFKSGSPESDHLKSGSPESDLLKSSKTDLDHLESHTIDLDHVESHTIDLDLLDSCTIELDYLSSSTTDLDSLKSGRTELDHLKSNTSEDEDKEIQPFLQPMCKSTDSKFSSPPAIPSPPPVGQLLQKAFEDFPQILPPSVELEASSVPSPGLAESEIRTGDFILDEVLPLLLEAEAACTVGSDSNTEEQNATSSVLVATSEDTTEPGPSWVEAWISTDDAENADNNHPAWDNLRKLKTDEERYEVVKNQWRQRKVPNPRVDLTCHNYKKNSSQRGTPIVFNSNDKQGQSRKRVRSNDDLNDDHPSKRRRTYSCTQMFENKIQQLRLSLDQDFENLNTRHDELLRNLGNRQQHQQQQLIQSNAPYYIVEQQFNDLVHCQEGEVDDLRARFRAKISRISKERNDNINLLMQASDEVFTFNKFYTALGDSDEDHRNISEEDMQQFEETEQMFEAFDQFYNE